MNKTVSTHAVLFNGDKVLLARRSKTDIRRPLQWDLPGGILEQDELINDGCAREIEEETGIKVEPKDLKLAYATNDEFEGKGSVSWLLFVTNTNLKEVKLSSEHDNSQWVTIDEAINMIEYPIYKDALRYIKHNHLIP